MMKRMNIAILTNSFSKNGGASKSIRECVKELQLRGNSVIILSAKSLCEEIPENMYIVQNDLELARLFNQYETELVIFFKASKSLIKESIFNRYVRVKKKIKRDTRTIMVLCQQPSNPDTILTTFEIKNCDHYIFIDKTAYNDQLYSFIPEKKKSWNYLSIPDNGPNPLDQYVKTDYSLKNGEIVFGRGSSFGKCPRNILEPFDNIKISCNKKFVIVGVPQRSNWLTNQIRDREDVVTYPLVSFDEWMSLVRSFDIGLYILPKNAHSSIDGTLGQMMRIGLPVIVGGAPAPKERIVHGQNGFIADSVSDIIHYAEMLAIDQTLREKIGKNARQSTIELNSKSWIDNLESIIVDVCGIRKYETLYVPFTARVKINTIYIYSLIKAWLERPFQKLLKVSKI